MGDLKKRSLLKTFTWRLIAMLIIMAIAYVFTGKPFLSLAIGGTDLLFKAVFYYLHERVWERVKWGKHPLAQLTLKRRDLGEEDMRIIIDRLRELGYL